MNDEIVKVPYPDFERMMTACCSLNDCLSKPSECQCCKNTNINLVEMLAFDEVKDDVD